MFFFPDRATNLPSDCFRLVPLVPPADVLLVVGANAVAHISQVRTTACYVNDYGKEELKEATYPVHTGKLTGLGESEEVY